MCYRLKQERKKKLPFQTRKVVKETVPKCTLLPSIKSQRFKVTVLSQANHVCLFSSDRQALQDCSFFSFEKLDVFCKSIVSHFYFLMVEYRRIPLIYCVLLILFILYNFQSLFNKSHISFTALSAFFIKKHIVLFSKQDR